MATRRVLARRWGEMPNRMDYDAIVGLIFADIGNPFFTELAQGAAAYLERVGRMCILADCQGDADRQLRIATALRDSGVKGLIITVPHSPEALTLEGVAVVAVDRCAPPVPYVSVDNVLGGRLATMHLVKCGYERIGILFGEHDLAPVKDRFDGYRQ